MYRSIATFTALLFGAAAGLLTAAPATAQGQSAVTVTVNGPSPFQPDPANPDSVLPELTGPGVSGVTVTVTSLENGVSFTSTTGSNGTVDVTATVGLPAVGSITVPFPPGVYEVTVEGDGHTGVTYVTIDSAGGSTDASFSLDGLPSTDSANGGTDAIDTLTDAANAASASGDADGLAEAQGELDAVANQNQSAVESLEEIADGLMEDLPPGIRDELEGDFDTADNLQEVDEAIDEGLESIAEATDYAAAAAAGLGYEYEITPETQAAIDALKKLRAILKKLKEHQLQLQAAQSALDGIASATAGNNSESYASVQHRANMLNNVQRNFAVVGRPVPRPHVPQVHRAPPVHRPPVETRRVIILSVGPSRR